MQILHNTFNGGKEGEQISQLSCHQHRADLAIVAGKDYRVTRFPRALMNQDSTQLEQSKPADFHRLQSASSAIYPISTRKGVGNPVREWFSNPTPYRICAIGTTVYTRYTQSKSPSSGQGCSLDVLTPGTASRSRS